MNRSRKPATRLFVAAALTGKTLELDADQSHYLGRVLRCRQGDRIVVFNGRGSERSAAIEVLAKRHARLALHEAIEPIPEPALEVVLLQALVKSDAMDTIVQKATELGVSRLMAVKTEFSVVRLDDDRRQRRLEHWHRITTSACEQCGRHSPPALELYDDLTAALAALPAEPDRVAFAIGPHPPFPGELGRERGVCVAVGPEGGFSREDTRQLVDAGFVLRSLGPRVLRADTAAIAACAGLSMAALDGCGPASPAGSD